MIVLYLSALTVGFSGAVMPGSLLTYTIREALSRGPRSGFVIILGHALLELALILLIFLGFDAVLGSDAARIAIGLFGGVLLLYMGADMIFQAARDRLAPLEDRKRFGSGNLFVSGIAISAGNPYFLLWWVVVGLGFVMRSYDSFGYPGVFIYYLGHISSDFIWYGAVSILVGTTRRFIGGKTYRVLVAVLGGLLVFFGGRFVFTALSALWDILR
jgi:threonine/homoserine/homoserine lactone efflux protein